MLDPFYLIIDHVRWLDRLLPEGVKLVQLRLKDLPEAEVRQQVVEARDKCAEFGAQLVVNDFWQIAIDENCDYIHLGQEDLDAADLPAIRRAGLRLGVSTHDDAELDRALSISPDYIALGPVFPTILKQMRWAPQGVEKVTRWKQLVGATPLVAIGGLTPGRAGEVLQAGADSAAVVTDILLNQDPEARTREWVAATAFSRKEGGAS